MDEALKGLLLQQCPDKPAEKEKEGVRLYTSKQVLQEIIDHVDDEKSHKLA